MGGSFLSVMLCMRNKEGWVTKMACNVSFLAQVDLPRVFDQLIKWRSAESNNPTRYRYNTTERVEAFKRCWYRSRSSGQKGESQSDELRSQSIRRAFKETFKETFKCIQSAVSAVSTIKAIGCIKSIVFNQSIDRQGVDQWINRMINQTVNIYAKLRIEAADQRIKGQRESIRRAADSINPTRCWFKRSKQAFKRSKQAFKALKETCSRSLYSIGCIHRGFWYQSEWNYDGLLVIGY